MWAQIKFDSSYPFTKNEKKAIVVLREIISGKVITNFILYQHGLYLCVIAGEILGIDVDSIHEMYQNLPIYLRNDLQITYLEIANILEKQPSKYVKCVEQKLIEDVLNKRVNNTFKDLKKYLIDNKEKWEKLCLKS